MTDPAEELVDYEEEELAPEPKAGADAGAAGAGAKKAGFVGIHSSGFKDFLLKPELLRAIVDCGFEHPSEGTRVCGYRPRRARGGRPGPARRGAWHQNTRKRRNARGRSSRVCPGQTPGRPRATPAPGRGGRVRAFTLFARPGSKRASPEGRGVRGRGLMRGERETRRRHCAANISVSTALCVCVRSPARPGRPGPGPWPVCDESPARAAGLTGL